jgi:hypothetical protein
MLFHEAIMKNPENRHPKPRKSDNVSRNPAGENLSEFQAHLVPRFRTSPEFAARSRPQPSTGEYPEPFSGEVLMARDEACCDDEGARPASWAISVAHFGSAPAPSRRTA